MYGNYGTYGTNASTLNSAYKTANAVNTATNWVVPALIVSFIVAIVIFFIFLSKKNEGRFIGFAGWLYDFLSFKKLVIEGILKILYITFALFITIMSFSSLSSSFLTFIVTLVVGNVVLRIGYEIMLVLLIVCRNTSEINKKMSGQ